MGTVLHKDLLSRTSQVYFICPRGISSMLQHSLVNIWEGTFT